ncbi:hypothetical protein BELL_0812g00030 [Botrytis elliptica]|uniref:Uncharacterized protein n=1 Tax=Botrytis elliptica TaxID=278938 RepID=A0A4Z1J569_9HELO|nr:hypothetical protein EAE99_011575 [Botrytis elliptica]TGO68726.1 hypothetical protein BELL_0812g00030 [Botrytis elliptica]
MTVLDGDGDFSSTNSGLPFRASRLSGRYLGKTAEKYQVKKRTGEWWSRTGGELASWGEPKRDEESKGCMGEM